MQKFIQYGFSKNGNNSLNLIKMLQTRFLIALRARKSLNPVLSILKYGVGLSHPQFIY